jgi:hypothetical protein
VENIKDPVVKDFWVKEFAAFGDKYTQEATPAIQNKIGQFTSNPLIRNIIGQPKSSFDIREVMDNKKILLINLSKGLVGDTNMRLLGSMLTTRLFLGAMSRAELDPEALKKSQSFYFYVDEFQNFANDTFAEILSEARKYNLNLVIAHQYVEQMEEQVRAAVFGNVGTTIAFRVGPFDAEVLETVFSPKFLKEDLVNLGFAQIYLSLMIDGVGSQPFSATTIPPIQPPVRSFKQEVIEASRQQFGTKRAGVENTILEELNSTAGENGPVEPPARKYPPKQSDGPRRDASSSSMPRRDDRPRSEPRAPQNAGDRPSEDRQGSSRPQSERAQAPRRDASQDARRDDRTRAQGYQQPAPSKPKSAEDLKSILRTMSQQPSKEKERQQAPKAPELKGALADVLKKQVPSETPMPQPAPNDAAPFVPAAPAVPSAPASGTPYEVPEETLRALFREPKQ